MVPKQHSWTIVIAGFWNRMIFNPQWVAQNVYERDEIETMVSVVPSAPVIYHSQGIELRISSTRLEFGLREAHDEGLCLAEKLACRVLEKLVMTPLSAVGVNFGYVEQNPSDELLEVLNFADDADMAAEGWDIKAKELKRSLYRDGVTFNLTYSLSNGTVVIDLNFHHSVDDASSARRCLSEKVLSYKSSGLALLLDAFQLQPQEG